MYDFFAQASSLHTNEQARAIKFYVEPSSVQINRASILELSVHSKFPVACWKMPPAKTRPRSDQLPCRKMPLSL